VCKVFDEDILHIYNIAGQDEKRTTPGLARGSDKA